MSSNVFVVVVVVSGIFPFLSKALHINDQISFSRKILTKKIS